MAHDRTDEMLMAAVRGGDLAELATLFERHSRRLFGFLRGLVGSPSAAEDLVQETFLRILRYRRSYRDGRPFLPWMLRIARNAARRHLRRRRRMPAEELAEMPAAGSPEQGHLERERAVRLTRALGTLPRREREVLLLSYFEGLRHREIARLVGASAGAVKVRVHRARARLRRHLAAGGESR